MKEVVNLRKSPVLKTIISTTPPTHQFLSTQHWTINLGSHLNLVLILSLWKLHSKLLSTRDRLIASSIYFTAVSVGTTNSTWKTTRVLFPFERMHQCWFPLYVTPLLSWFTTMYLPCLIEVDMNWPPAMATMKLFLTFGVALCGIGSLISLEIWLWLSISNGMHKSFSSTTDQSLFAFFMNRGPPTDFGMCR